MWWIPPSVANAALWGPTSTLLTWAHLRNSLGNGTMSSGCAHRKRLTAKTADPSSTIKAFFILRLRPRSSLSDARFWRKDDFDQTCKSCDELDRRIR